MKLDDVTFSTEECCIDISSLALNLIRHSYIHRKSWSEELVKLVFIGNSGHLVSWRQEVFSTILSYDTWTFSFAVELDGIFTFTEVKKQAVMADDLQTQHDQRLLRSYFMQWTEKTRQMQRAKELHNQTILKRLDIIPTCLCLVWPSLNPRNTISLRFWSVYGEVITHLPLSLAHAFLCPGRINGILHTTLQELSFHFLFRPH